MRIAPAFQPDLVVSGSQIKPVRLTIQEAAQWIRDGSMHSWRTNRWRGHRNGHAWPTDLEHGERWLREAIRAGVVLKTLGDLSRFAESGGAVE